MPIPAIGDNPSALPGGVPVNGGGRLGGVRTTIGVGDSFRTAAGAFPTVPSSYLNAFKMQQVAVVNDAGQTESKVVLDRMLIDLSELDVAAMDTQRIIKDCEYVRELLLRNPDAPRRLAAAFHPDAPETDVIEAAKLAKAIGLTEEDSLKAGGGLIFLVGALVVTIVAAGITELVKNANAIKYKHAVARASGSDPNTGTIHSQ